MSLSELSSNEMSTSDIEDRESLHSKSPKERYQDTDRSAIKNSTKRVRTKPVRGNFECNNCNRKFEFESRLKRHLNKAGGCQLTSCDVCGKVFKTAQSSRRHLETVHASIRVECDRCEATFSRQDVLVKVWIEIHLRFCSICLIKTLQDIGDPRFYYGLDTSCLRHYKIWNICGHFWANIWKH